MNTPLSQQVSEAYTEIKAHFDRFASQICFTNVDTIEAWHIKHNELSAFLFRASDGCCFLARGSCLGDLTKVEPPVDPDATGSNLFRLLPSNVSNLHVLQEHFKVDDVDSTLAAIRTHQDSVNYLTPP